jgi:membrane-associated phospholipid phosphatase
MIKWLQSFEGPLLDFFFEMISFLGEEFVYIAILSAIYWLYNKRLGEFIGVTLGVTFALNTGLKELFSKPRPFEVSDEIINKRPETSTGHSMPSGHTQGAATFYMSTALGFKKRYGIILASMMTLLMMLSRMYLGVHYLEDVLVGALLGILLSVISYYLFFIKNVSNLLLHRIYLVTMIVFLPLGFIFIAKESANDFYKGYGIMIGIMSGVMFEKRWVNFRIIDSFKGKLMRYLVGVVSLALVLTLTGVIADALFSAQVLINLIDLCRYTLIGFLGFGLYPFLFTKYNF